MRIKTGIFFGGPSREREISFAGGRAVFDYLDKSIFEPIPIFIDSRCNFILLDWENLYKGTIRSFYPTADRRPPSPHNFQIYVESMGELSLEEQDALIADIGQRIPQEELPQLISVALLTLHGEFGQDGRIQAILQELRIPFTGSGVKSGRIGMDIILQREIMAAHGFALPKMTIIRREEWSAETQEALFQRAIAEIGFPMVVRPSGHGASVGLSIVEKKGGAEAFVQSLNRAFFREIIPIGEWSDRNEFERVEYVHLLADIREGLGFPLVVQLNDERHTIFHPEDLLHFLNERAITAGNEAGTFIVEAVRPGDRVIVEQYIEGSEFTCAVVHKEDGAVAALLPIGIARDGQAVKYSTAASQKPNAVDLPENWSHSIGAECERLFQTLGFQAFAQIGGIVDGQGKIYLNNPDTMPGLFSSSLIYRQAAGIGLAPSRFLTFLIRTSIQERITEAPEEAAYRSLLRLLDEMIESRQTRDAPSKRIGVIFGGYAPDRHISIQSGRYVFELLSGSEKYSPLPIFLTGQKDAYELFLIPLHLLYADNADTIRESILNRLEHPGREAVKTRFADVTQKYASSEMTFEPVKIDFDILRSITDGVFIALHSRPGADGELQMQLEARDIPYNGSGVKSSGVTIDKYRTLQTLKRNGFSVPDQLLLKKTDYEADPREFLERIDSRMKYPFVAKPVDSGCSSAVKKIRNRGELEAYVQLMFRPQGREGLEFRRRLRLKAREEFPPREEILFESLVAPAGAGRFLEISAGILTHYDRRNNLEFEIFEPSEIPAAIDPLSPDEQLLEGEERHITPAQFSVRVADNKFIADEVKTNLEKAARTLGVLGYAQIDAFARIFENGRIETVIFDLNSLPVLMPGSSIFHQAAINKYKPFELVDKILSFAFDRQAHKSGTMTGAAHAAAVVSQTANSFEKEMKKDDEKAIEPDPHHHKASPSHHRQDESPGAIDTRLVGTFSQRLRESFIRVLRFLQSPAFLKNFGALAAMALLLFVLTIWWLKFYTHHGESLQVQNYIGMNLDDAVRKARSRSFKVVVIDSVFDPDQRPHEVYQQDPTPLSRVKENRTIYLSVYSSTPPMVTLPSLVGNYDFNQYKKKLKSLKVGAEIQERVFDGKLEENTILHFYYGNQKITDSDLRRDDGLKVPQGAILRFVVTERNTGMVPVPNLVCMDYRAATFLISSMNLTLGTIYGDVYDQESAFVWKQEPAFDSGQQLPMGTQIDIYLSSARPSGCPEEESPGDLQENDQNIDEDFN